MAKAPAKAEEGDDVPKKKGKLGLIIVIVLLVVLILVAVGVGALLLLKGGKDKDPEEHAQQAAPAAAQLQTAGTVDLTKPPTFVPLDAFTVNLRRDEGDHYLQVVAVLRVADATMDATLKPSCPRSATASTCCCRASCPRRSPP